MGRIKQPKTIDWLIKKYMDFFKEFRMEEENIRSYYAEWRLKFGDRIEDFLWHIFNHMLQENATQSKDIIGFLKRNRDIYFHMLFFRRKEEGKRANEILQSLNRIKLELQYEESNLVLDVMVSPCNDCKPSQELKDKVFSFKELFKQNVIPYDRCTKVQGCACSYIYRAKRDSEDNLIYLNK